jgi:hypothetical protein
MSATRSFRTPHEQLVDSGDLAKARSRRSLLSVVCKDWDSLDEVREFLELRQSRVQPCVPVRRRLEQKLNHVHRKLTDFQKLKHELRVALRSCNKELHKQSARCQLTHITTHFEFMTTNGEFVSNPGWI